MDNRDIRPQTRRPVRNVQRDDPNEFLSRVVQKRPDQAPKRKRLFGRSSSASAIRRLSDGSATQEQGYIHSLFGAATPKPREQEKKINVQLSISFKKPSFGRLSTFFNEHRTPVTRFGIVMIIVLLSFPAFRLISAQLNKSGSDAAVKGALSPPTIFMPRPLPENFYISSGEQHLANGAIMYGIYGPSGENITITQQSEPAEFEGNILSGALKFDTPYGAGYIVESTERTTGYLLADDSWVLLNGPQGFSTQDMRTLISSLKPSSGQ